MTQVSPSPVRGTLYVVSTPIGNMGDFSFRAVEVLRSVAVVLAEDTRHSRPLLQRYDIHTPLASHHEHNEARTTPAIVARLRDGEDVALISDAGTPLLSDPGGRLVRAAIEAGIVVVPVPGASAVLAALVGAGLAANEFTWFGFLPRRGSERDARLDEISSSPRTAVLYESPNRLVDTLHALASRAGGDREAVVARELTKRYEEFRRGTLDALAAYYEETPPKGEIVVLLAGAAPAAPDEHALLAEARTLRATGLTTRDIAAELVRRGAARNMAYRVATKSEIGNRTSEMGDE